MGVGYNPKIVTNGLILCLDAGNPKSYPGSGTTVYDISGSGNHFTIQGNVSWSAATGFSNFTGNSTGSGNKIYRSSFPTNLKVSQGGNGYTIVILANSTGGSGSWRKLVGNNDADNYIDLYQNPGSPYGFYTESGDTLMYNSAIGVNQNTLAMTDSVYRLYIATSIDAGTVTNPVGALSIGNEPGNNAYPWVGNIVCVFLYNRVLSSEEMTQNYRALRGRFGI